jgi:hypothetical protein
VCFLFKRRCVPSQIRFWKEVTGESVRAAAVHAWWKTSSIRVHHSPGFRDSRGSCIGSMMDHHLCVAGSDAIFAMSAAKSSPQYSK